MSLIDCYSDVIIADISRHIMHNLGLLERVFHGANIKVEISSVSIIYLFLFLIINNVVIDLVTIIIIIITVIIVVFH